MAVPVEEFVHGIEASDDASHFAQVCRDAGLETAINMAMVEPSMHEELLGENIYLVKLFIACVSQAKSLVDG